MRGTPEMMMTAALDTVRHRVRKRWARGAPEATVDRLAGSQGAGRAGHACAQDRAAQAPWIQAGP